MLIDPVYGDLNKKWEKEEEKKSIYEHPYWKYNKMKEYLTDPWFCQGVIFNTQVLPVTAVVIYKELQRGGSDEFLVDRWSVVTW